MKDFIDSKETGVAGKAATALEKARTGHDSEGTVPFWLRETPLEPEGTGFPLPGGRRFPPPLFGRRPE